MKALFYISTEIGEENILWGLLEAGIIADRSENVIELNSIRDDQVDAVRTESAEYDFVITRDFSVNVAEGCHLSGTPYISWCYDSPVMALYRREALYPTNHIFVFDRMHLKRLKELGIEHAYYQPLAANMTKAELTVITDADMRDYRCDISFVGSMYNRDFYQRFRIRASEKAITDCERVFEAHKCIWNNGSVFNELSDETVVELYSLLDDNRKTDLSIDDRYMTELLVLVPELTARERFLLLDVAGRRFDTVLHTKQPESILGKISADVRPPLNQLSDELYKTYAAAKINLNLTMRSIETGIPQRIYDIMSIGGCVFSNYQEEAAELFIPEKEIVLFGSEDEFMDKAMYYLSHERDRMEICINGYKRVRDCYTYPIAVRNMISYL